MKFLNLSVLLVSLISFSLTAHSDEIVNVNSSVFIANQATTDNVTYNILVGGEVFFVGSMQIDGEIQINDPANLNPQVYFTDQLTISGFSEAAPIAIEVLDVGGFVLQTPFEARQAAPQFGLSVNAFGGDVIVQTDLDLPGGIDLSSSGGRVIIGAGKSVETASNFQINGVVGFHLEPNAFIRADRGLFIVHQNSVQNVFSIFDGRVQSGASVIVFSNLFPYPGRIFVNGEINTRFANLSGNQIFINGAIVADPTVGDISLFNTGPNEMTELGGNALLSADRVCLDNPVVDFGATIIRNRGC